MDSLPYLKTVEDIPYLATILVPEQTYKSARSAKGRMREPRVDAFVGKNSNQLSIALFPHPHSAESLLRTLPIEDDDRNMSPLSKPRQVLAPLIYLQTTPPHRRHPLDEEALMSFTPGLLT